MNESVLSQKSLTFGNARTYLTAAVFVAGNIVLPQLCHLIPQGGLIFLPIYLFTLIGALTFGWRVGLITAVLSPLVNNVLFGMPPVAMLPVIEVKSVILATIAGVAALKLRKLGLLSVAAIVIVAQLAGGLFEWAYKGSLAYAVQDFRIGFPGLILQIVAGYVAVRLMSKK